MTDTNLDKIQLWDQDTFGVKLAECRTTGATFWDLCCELIVQGILNYHRNSYSTGRLQQVYDMLCKGGHGSQTTAFTHLVRQTTGVTNIKPGDTMKHDQNVLKKRSDWAVILEKLVDGAALREFAGKPGSKSRTSDAKPRIRTPQISEAVVNAAQPMVDALADMPEADAVSFLQRITRGGEAGSVDLTAFQYAEVREEVSTFVATILEEEKFGKDHAILSVRKATDLVRVYIDKTLIPALQELSNKSAANDSQVA